MAPFEDIQKLELIELVVALREAMVTDESYFFCEVVLRKWENAFRQWGWYEEYDKGG